MSNLKEAFSSALAETLQAAEAYDAFVVLANECNSQQEIDAHNVIANDLKLAHLTALSRLTWAKAALDESELNPA